LITRKKVLYEIAYPETKHGVSQAIGMNTALGNNVSGETPLTTPVPPFREVATKVLGVDDPPP
jgi:hypothetical protein